MFFYRSCITAVLALSAVAVWADARGTQWDRAPEAALQIQAASELVRSQKLSKYIPASFTATLEKALGEYRRGDVSHGKQDLVHAIQVLACTVDGARQPDKPGPAVPPELQIKKDDPPRAALLKTLTITRPELVQAMAKSSAEATRQAFRDGVAQSLKLQQFDRKILASKPKAPKTPDQFRQEIQDSQLARLNAGFDTPEEEEAAIRRMQEFRRSSPEKEKFQEEQYERALRSYRTELAAWRTKRSAGEKQIRGMSAEQLLTDPNLRKAWSIVAAADPGFTRVSGAMEHLADAAGEHPLLAFNVLTSRAQMHWVGSTAQTWFEQHQEFVDHGPPDVEQTRISARYGEAYQKAIDALIADGKSSKFRTAGIYEQMDLVRDGKGRPQDLADLTVAPTQREADRQMSELPWLGVKVLGAELAIAAAILTAQPEIAAAVLPTLGLGAGAAGIQVTAGALMWSSIALGGVDLAHSIAMRDPRKSFVDNLKRPDSLAEVGLFLAMLPAPMLQKAIESSAGASQLAKWMLKTAGRNANDAGAVAALAKNIRVAAPLLKAGTQSFFSMQAMQSVGLAAQSCQDSEPGICASQLGLALLQALPQGIDTYQALKAPSCAACLAKDRSEPEGALCVVKPKPPADPERVTPLMAPGQRLLAEQPPTPGARRGVIPEGVSPATTTDANRSAVGSKVLEANAFKGKLTDPVPKAGSDGRRPTVEEALWEAHLLGERPIRDDGTLGEYPREVLAQKARLLRDYGFSPQQIDALLRANVCGSSLRPRMDLVRPGDQLYYVRSTGEVVQATVTGVTGGRARLEYVTRDGQNRHVDIAIVKGAGPDATDPRVAKRLGNDLSSEEAAALEDGDKVLYRRSTGELVEGTVDKDSSGKIVLNYRTASGESRKVVLSNGVPPPPVLPPGKGPRAPPAGDTPSDYRNSPGRRIRTADQAYFVRDPAAAVKDPNYIPNAVESIDYFDAQLGDLSRVSVDRLEEITKKMHVVAAFGKNGDRPYSGATNKEVEPGQFWEHDGVSNGRPSGEYAREVERALGENFNRSELSIRIGSLPEEARPSNFGGRHHYPASRYFHLYFQHGTSLLNRLGRASARSPEALRLIAEYYHTMANARPFNTINNSLFFNQTNYLLRRYGFSAVSQGYLDHLAHQLQPEDFSRVFSGHVQGRVPLPSEALRKNL